MDSGSSISGMVINEAIRNSQNSNQNPQIKKIYTVFVFSFCIGILCIVTILAWAFSGKTPGFSWSDSSKKFNYHPLFLTIGLIFMLGQSMHLY